jgi:TRAP-type C4-dicarboxylate transport system permease small subunit
MIGSMVGMREGTHFIVDMWPRLSPRADAVLQLVSGIAVLVFAVVFVIAGWEFTEFAFNRISELAELPLWMIHIAWPLLGLSWLAFHGERMVDLWRVATGREGGARA